MQYNDILLINVNKCKHSFCWFLFFADMIYALVEYSGLDSGMRMEVRCVVELL